MKTFAKLLALTLICLSLFWQVVHAETITLVADEWAPFNVPPQSEMDFQAA
jgi:hypothetical protein